MTLVDAKTWLGKLKTDREGYKAWDLEKNPELITRQRTYIDSYTKSINNLQLLISLAASLNTSLPLTPQFYATRGHSNVHWMAQHETGSSIDPITGKLKDTGATS